MKLEINSMAAVMMRPNVKMFEDAEVLMKPCYFLRFDKSGNVIESHEEVKMNMVMSRVKERMFVETSIYIFQQILWSQRLKLVQKNVQCFWLKRKEFSNKFLDL